MLANTQASSSVANAKPMSEPKTTTDDDEGESEPLEDKKKGFLCHREHFPALKMP